MSKRNRFAVLAALAALAVAPLAGAQSAGAMKREVARGKYLVDFGGCNDCHSPKLMTPRGPALDGTRLLSGYPASAPVPAVPASAIGMGPGQWAAMTTGDLTAWVGPWGVSFAANLTPDKATGLGKWSAEDFLKTMRTGKHLGVSRPILPPMPTMSIAALTDADIKAIFAYLGSIEPIVNAVPKPLPPK